MVIIMVGSVLPLLIESALIILQTVPNDIDIDELKQRLLDDVDGIVAVSLLIFYQKSDLELALTLELNR